MNVSRSSGLAKIILQGKNKENITVFYAPEGTSGGILKSHRPSVRLSVRSSVSPSVTNRVSAISHKLLKQI